MPNKTIEAGNELEALREGEAYKLALVNENLAQTIFNNAPSMMLLLDENTGILQANFAALKLSGKTQSEVIGLRGGDLFSCVGLLNNPEGCGFGELCKKYEDPYHIKRNEGCV